MPNEIGSVQETDFVISGLSLEGAEWSYEEKKLNMTDNLSCLLPKIIFRWSPKKGNESKKEFNIPVYLSNTRKNLLFSVLMLNESDLTDYDWYQRGTALISWNKEFDFTNMIK